MIATLRHESLISLLFPCYFLFFPVPEPAISADVLDGTHFFAGFGCRPAPLYRDLQQGTPVVRIRGSNHIAASINLVLRSAAFGGASRRTATSKIAPAAILRDARRAKSAPSSSDEVCGINLDPIGVMESMHQRGGSWLLHRKLPSRSSPERRTGSGLPLHTGCCARGGASARSICPARVSSAPMPGTLAKPC